MTAHHAWHRILFSAPVSPGGRTKTHVTPGCLRDDLIADMDLRGVRTEALASFAPIRRIRDWCIDLGGAINTAEPRRVYRVDNLPIEILSGHVGAVHGMMADARIRRFASGKTYYKTHGAWHCLVLLPRQHDALVDMLAADADSAARECAEFFDNIKTKRTA